MAAAGTSGFFGFGEQQQRRDAQVFHDFHVVAFAVFGLFQGVLHLGDGRQILQHFGGFGAEHAAVAAVQAETAEEALAPLAQCGGTVSQRLVIGRQQQNDGHVVAGELALDHLLQADQGVADVVLRLAFEQLGGINQPAFGIEAGTGATAAEQQAMQFGRRDVMTAGSQQGGEGLVRGILNGHGQLGARRRYV